MSHLKLSISATMRQSGPPSRKETSCKRPTLNDKIEYALDCLEADTNKEEAVDFLQKAYHRIQKRFPYKETDSDLMEKLSSVFNTYGIKYENSEN